MSKDSTTGCCGAAWGHGAEWCDGKDGRRLCPHWPEKSQTTDPTYVDRLDLHEGPVEMDREPLNRKFSGKLKPITIQPTVEQMIDGILEALEKQRTEIEHLKLVMRECCDAIRDQDDMGALRMLEVALNG